MQKQYATPITGESQDMVKSFVQPPMSMWQANHRENGSIIATGHQAGFWHPGILAKNIAAVQHAKQIDGRAVYLLVDHDDNQSGLLQLPVSMEGQLEILTIDLAPSLPGVALKSQPLIDWNETVRILREANQSKNHQVVVDLLPLLSILESLASSDESTKALPLTRAHQWAQLLQRMWQSIAGELEIIHATSLVDESITDRLLHDAMACAHHYNEAVHANPQAGMSRLIVERDRIELPLWEIGDVSSPHPRQRVFADISDSKPMLITSDGEPIVVRAGEQTSLAPRALLLTAMMRSQHCDLFIHGHGGGIYDRVMEQWWQQWMGESLAPMAVVSADVRLPFPGIAQASHDDLSRAIWFEHHLPHNLDRHLPAIMLDRQAVDRKHEILQMMETTQEPRARAAWFRELHRINEQLAGEHRDVLLLANDQLNRVKLGIANQAVALKRDWSFMFYSRDSLERLKSSFSIDPI